MIYALLKAFLLKPELLFAHMRNYGEFIRSETREAVHQWTIKIVAGVAGAIFLLLFLMLSGVAIMVGVLQAHFHWVLVLIPAIALFGAIVSLIVALRKVQHNALQEIGLQLLADVNALTAPAKREHEN